MDEKKQIEFYVKFKNKINGFCENNNLDIDELFTHPLSCNNKSLIFYYMIGDEEIENYGLYDEGPKLKPLLSIYLKDNKLDFILDEKIEN